MLVQKGFIFYLDGTVYVDNNLIDGAATVIKKLKELGRKVVFLTNKSIESISAYAKKLNRLGIKVNEQDVINSNYLVDRYLKLKIEKSEKVMIIGEQQLYDKLLRMDIYVSDTNQEVSYVVLVCD